MDHTLHFLPGPLEAVPGISAGVDDVQGGVGWLDDAGHVSVAVVCPSAAVIRAIIDHEGTRGAGDLEGNNEEESGKVGRNLTENDSKVSLMPNPSSTLSSHLHPPPLDKPEDSITPLSPEIGGQHIEHDAMSMMNKSWWCLTTAVLAHLFEI